MNRPPVERIRRLALAALVVVSVVIAGNYGLRRWRAYRARQAVPSAMPSDVEQQTEKFTFSRSEEGRTLFTVEASRTIERTGKTTVLEDVVVEIRGRRGDRADQIRTGRCEYDVEGAGTIICPGEVTVQLGRGQTPAAAPPLELITTALQFDPATGVAWTDQPVEFAFPQGAGEAVGLRYQPSEPRLRLEKAVTLRVGRDARAPVRIRGAQLRYNATAQAFELVPPLFVETDDRRLTAERLRMELDQDFRTQRIEAAGNVQVEARQDGRRLTMQAARAEALYAEEGGIRQLRAAGQVRFHAQGSESREQLSCQEAVFDFDPSHRWIERIVATGKAHLVSQTAEETRELRAPILEMAGPPGSRQQVLTARQRGRLVLQRRSGEQRTVTGDRIDLRFEARQRLRNLMAAGAVEMTDARPGRHDRSMWSRELRARFDDEGKLAAAELWGEFRYRGGRWQAEAGRAEYQADTESFQLREQPVIWDAATRTSARVVEVEERTGTVRAEGEVRTTRRSSADDRGGFGTDEPLHLAADRMRAEEERGWARYEGRARLWQGESRLAASSIELFRTPGRLVAEGNVSSLFLEATEGGKVAESPAPPRRAVTVTAERFTYVEGEARGLFEGEVRARNDFGTLTAPQLEVFLAAGDREGADRVQRVQARGGVRIEQGGRQAVSEEAEYDAGAQTVVLWGGTPTITDPQRGTTAGARLTLFLADGTIRVDSGEGTRTVTRRPWTR